MLLTVSIRAFFILSIAATLFAANDTTIVWEINSLSSIGGNSTTKNGTPKLISTEIGEAVEFTQKPDQLLVKNNPLGDATAWTIQTIIKPYSISSSGDDEPRYLHLQDPSNDKKRITMELRVNKDDTWYFDGYIKSTKNNFTLIDSKLKHPVNEWYNATITYQDGVFISYVNGKQECTGAVTYEPVGSAGVVSIGCRMNNVSYLKGAIKKVIFTHAVLTPDKFDKSYTGTSTDKAALSRPRLPLRSTATPFVIVHRTNLPKTLYSLSGRAIPNGISSPPLSSGVIIGSRAIE